MRGLKTAGRILSYVLTGLLVLVLLCNIYTIAARNLFGIPQPTVLGCSVAVVLSGSMEDALTVNDLVVTRKQEQYAVGDIISYINDGKTTGVTHRIIEITQDGYLTKGDANSTPDPDPIPRERIVGKVVLVIPKVGYIIEYLRSPLGLLAVTLIGIGLICLPSALSGRYSNTGRNEDEGKEDAQE